MTSNTQNDPMGLAAMDYLQGQRNGKILVRSNIAEDDYIPADYLFRTLDDMPQMEQTALDLCIGQTLDIGAGVGSHSLELKKKGLNVTSLDISPLNCQVAKARGLQNVLEADFYTLPTTTKYDTLLLLMNGIGIAGTLANLPFFLNKAKELLTPNGQILLDSSDLKYLYADEEGYLVPLGESYYGELTYTMRYKKAKCHPFKWLFIDADLLALVSYNFV